MVKIFSEEEKKLMEIYTPYFDYKKLKLRDDAPPEAIEALKKLKEIAKKDIDPNNI